MSDRELLDWTGDGMSDEQKPAVDAIEIAMRNFARECAYGNQPERVQSAAALRAAIDAAVAAERERLVPDALHDVAAERRRQIEVEGWTPEHDDCHRDGSLAKAAYCYAWAACGLGMESPPPAPPGWPWAGTWWKPRDTRSNLVRAAALLLAEIERLDRQAPAGEKT